MLLPNFKPILLLLLTILSAMTFLAFMPAGAEAQSFAQPAEFPPKAIPASSMSTVRAACSSAPGLMAAQLGFPV